jgi:hypothetical protein
MPAVTREALGAWLLRCNPSLSDLAARFRTPARSWCVADNYRSRLMAPGDPVLLWVSGQHRRFVRGIWAAGPVTEPAHPTDTSGLRVGVELRLAPEPLVTDAELRAAGVDDLEVQRMPQGSNPSWVSADQLARVVALCPALHRTAARQSSRRAGDPAGTGAPQHHSRAAAVEAR